MNTSLRRLSKGSQKIVKMEVTRIKDWIQALHPRLCAHKLCAKVAISSRSSAKSAIHPLQLKSMQFFRLRCNSRRASRKRISRCGQSVAVNLSRSDSNSRRMLRMTELVNSRVHRWIRQMQCLRALSSTKNWFRTLKLMSGNILGSSNSLNCTSKAWKTGSKSSSQKTSNLWPSSSAKARNTNDN